MSVGNFTQRISLIRKVRNVETKENSQRRLNNNNAVIKHSQGPLVDIFPKKKKEIEMANKCTRRCSASLVTREMQIKKPQ